MLVINQPDAVSNIAVPMLDTKLTVHMTVKAKWLKGPQRDGAGSAGVKAIVTNRALFASTRVLACEMNFLLVWSAQKFDGESKTVSPNLAIRCQRGTHLTLAKAFSYAHSESKLPRKCSSVSVAPAWRSSRKQKSGTAPCRCRFEPLNARSVTSIPTRPRLYCFSDWRGIVLRRRLIRDKLELGHHDGQARGEASNDKIGSIV
jgi:hypothetical protein